MKSKQPTHQITGLAKICFLIACAIILIQQTKLANSFVTQGSVIILEGPAPNKDLTTIIQYFDQQGELHRLKPKFISKLSTYEAGEKVNIFIGPLSAKSPYWIETKNFTGLWLLPLSALFLGCCLLALSFLIQRLR